MNQRKIANILASTYHGLMIVNRFDVNRLQNGDAFGVGHSLLECSSFEASEIESILTVLNLRREHYGDGCVALDCGANIGVQTIEMSKHMTGWGRVISFEAQEYVYYTLAGNIAINNCFNARAIYAAVSDAPGDIVVPQMNYFSMGSFGSLSLMPENSFNVNDTGQNFITDVVDFIKVDVEGMELKVLHGALHSIRANKPVLLVEYIKSPRRELEAFLEKLGYCVRELGIMLLAVHKDDKIRKNLVVNGALV
jgi:FkbM family methyltransferase